MFFDHKTGKTTGKLHRYTKEEIEAMDKAVRDGKAVSTKHPKDDMDVFKNRDVESDIMRAEALAAKNGIKERTDEIENMLKAMADEV